MLIFGLFLHKPAAKPKILLFLCTGEACISAPAQIIRFAGHTLSAQRRIKTRMLPTQIQTQQNKHGFFVILFIYLSIFVNSYVFFREPFEFYFGYIIFIVLLPGYIIRYGFNGNMFFIFFTLLVTGMFNVFLGNNTTNLFFKVYAGLFMSYFFYYYIVLDFDYDIERLFRWYLIGSYVAAVIGIIQFVSFRIGFVYGYEYRFILNKWGLSPGGLFGLRVNSIFAEPTHLGSVLSAAFFVSLYNLFRRETYGITRTQSIVIIVVYLLSFSSLGQTGVFLSIILLAVNFGVVRYVLLVIPLGIALFNVLYAYVIDFRERLDGLITLFSGGQFKLGKTHGSSFILYNNYHVALENFKTNFVFGTGVGSHPVAFEKHSIAKDIKVYGFSSNSADANSMLLRLISETGLFGVLIFLFVMFRFYVRRNAAEDTYHWLISNSILVMILLNLFRQGHYFLNGFPFFIMIYIFNSVLHKNHLEEKAKLKKEERIKNTDSRDIIAQ